MPTVQFVDHSEAIGELLKRKVQAACVAAADSLHTEYGNILQATIAPPHSKPGEIPHAYLGHKIGGYGPVNKFLEANNQPKQGFASVQTRYLSSYIESSENASTNGAVVGFKPGHVVNRRMNYLIWHDQHGRPWVRRGYEMSSMKMRTAAQSAFKEAK